RGARLNHVLPVDEGRYAHAPFPARAFAAAPWATAMGWDFHLRPIVGCQDDDRVVKLTSLLQGGNQPAENVVHLNHRVAEDGTCRRPAGVLVVGVIVEVAAARAVIEEPRLVGAGLVTDEFLAVVSPVLIEVHDRLEVDRVDIVNLLLAFD